MPLRKQSFSQSILRLMWKKNRIRKIFYSSSILDCRINGSLKSGMGDNVKYSQSTKSRNYLPLRTFRWRADRYVVGKIFLSFPVH